MEPCPAPDSLQQLLEDSLAGAARTSVAIHVDRCPACQQKLDQLTTISHQPLEPLSNEATAFLLALKQDAPASLDGVIRPSSTVRSTPSEPLQLPGYEILRELGHGGMGVVYEARQLSLNRLVAIKMIDASLRATPEVLARFATEAQALGRLRHPNIVQIYELGQHEGKHYLTLELVAGGSLSSRLRGIPWPTAAAASLVEKLAGAIHSAHEQGVLHRDLKPANVMLSAEPLVQMSESKPGTLSMQDSALRALEPKVTDFGLAKLLDDDSNPTPSSEMLGTPSYMAPEQAVPGLDQAQTVGPTADVYSLGAILYELLTGRPPFKGESPVETVYQVVHQEVVPPSRLQPKVPTDLETVCLKCLEKLPLLRYRNAQELADDLRRFREGVPVLARRASIARHLWRWVCRRPALAGLTAALLLSLLGGMLATTLLWRGSEAHRERAELREGESVAAQERAETNLYFSRIAQARLAYRLNDVGQMHGLLAQCVPHPGDPDRRGWEWHYLHGLTATDLGTVTVADHISSDALVMHPDGRQVLVAGGNFKDRQGSLFIWDAAPSEAQPGILRELPGHPHLITCIAISPDGCTIASGGKDNEVRLRDEQGDHLRILQLHAADINSVAFSPDGRALVSADTADRTIVWDCETGKQCFSAPGRFALFSLDGQQVITCAAQGIRIHETKSGQLLRTLPVVALGACLSPDGNALGFWNLHDAGVIDLATGQIKTSINHPGGVLWAAFSPDGEQFATAGSDQSIRLWGARTGVEAQVLRGHLGRVRSLAFHPSGRFLVSCCPSPGEIKLWDLTTLQELRTAAAPEMEVVGLSFTPECDQVLVARRGGLLQTRSALGANTGEDRSLPLAQQWLVPTNLAAFSGKWIAGVKQPLHEVGMWNRETGVERYTLRGHAGPVYHVGWSGNGQRLVTSSLAETKDGKDCREVKVWAADTGQLLAEFQPVCASEKIKGLFGVAALSPDGSQVAYDEAIPGQTEDANEPTTPTRMVTRSVNGDGQPLSLAGQTGALRVLSFSPDSRLMASGSKQGRLVVHQLQTGHALPGWPLQTSGALGDVAFSPDARLLASVDREQVRLWHVATGQEVLSLRAAPPRNWDPGFTPLLTWSQDGRQLACTTWQRTVSVWDAPLPQDVLNVELKRRAATARAFAWHLDKAEQAMSQPAQAFAIAFHLQHLSKLMPPDSIARLRRGDLYARMCRWKEAVADYRQAVDSRSLPARWHELALLQQYTGDDRGYQSTCSRMLEAIHLTNDPRTLASLMRAHLFLPHSELLLRWSRTAQSAQADSNLFESLHCIAAYRTGRYQEAVQAGERALQAPHRHTPLLLDWLFLAMANARLQRQEEAKHWFDRVDAWLASVSRTPQPDWPLWCEAQLLLRKAQSSTELPK